MRVSNARPCFSSHALGASLEVLDIDYQRSLVIPARQQADRRALVAHKERETDRQRSFRM